MTLPPIPWSERMANASAVRTAYLEAETNISEQLMSDNLTLTEEQALLRQLQAARLQSNAAHAQMWIIHKEEQR